MSKFSIILVLSFSLVSAMMGKSQRKKEHTDWKINELEGEKIVKCIDGFAKSNQEISTVIKNFYDKNSKQQINVQDSLKSIESLLSESVILLKNISQKPLQVGLQALKLLLPYL